MLTTKLFPVTQVYVRPNSGNWIYIGYVINLPHNVQNIKDSLIRLSNELSLVVFATKRYNRVRMPLWLK